MSRIRALAGHLAAILGIMFLVFLVLDQFNPMMNFIDNGISRILLAALCLCGIVRGVMPETEGIRPEEADCEGTGKVL